MSSIDEVREILDFATDIAREAGDLTLRHFGAVVAHDSKGDGTPVTIADREAEQHLRRRIAERFPDHGILGEEFGDANSDARVRWVLDPIDATRSFMRGVPLYGVLIGVEVEGAPTVGVAHFPPLRETVAAGVGLGCTLNGEPCRVSETSSIEESLVLTTDVERILSGASGDGWRKLQQRAAFSRTWGDCYGHALVATGRAEVMVDPIQAPWDAGPFPVLISEAGGRFSSLEGEWTMHGGSGISTNGVLHDEVLAALTAR
ncbi:MAG: inositol monophosphatase family protein [Gemmatimonadota bacterium]|nr:inositol monophosphatase family protein [Gemmatimonadota bacterium]MDH5758007.1 inositol monophosphatase family protein [Gemmatimonadota bacterium]